MTELGWKSVGVLELTALAEPRRRAVGAAVREADVLLVNGGDPMYLHHWMVESGLAELLPTLDDTVYVGLSAGSMVLTPRIGEDFVEWRPPTRRRHDPRPRRLRDLPAPRPSGPAAQHDGQRRALGGRHAGAGATRSTTRRRSR